MNRKTSGTLAGALVLSALAAVNFSAGVVRAQIVGFGNGSNFTLNGYDQPTGQAITNANDPPTISSGILTITTSAAGEGRSAFYNTPQSVAGFTASFIYQDNLTGESPLGVADGFAFVVQNEGLTAVGGSGSGLGYTINGSRAACPFL